MKKNIRIIEAVDNNILREREKWNDLLEGAWRNISLYVGKAFDMPVYSFRNLNDISFEGFGTHVIAIKQSAGTLKFYHPLSCLFTTGNTLFEERMLVKLVTFVEEQVHPWKKPYTTGSDVFNYSLQEVSGDKINRMMESIEITKEATVGMSLLIEKVNGEA